MITVNGDKLDWREGMTVQDVLDAKNYTFRMISVWIDGNPVERRDQYATTPVPDESVVQVIHNISGG
ncbi:sulfur carrier protein ThiS [Synergistaceae bacterium OttesenSCG-928-I11]|nr:sulfur carrier protein ThiS [Synergistaceae bacterium OttesenSCG-928-I11]